MSELYPTTSPPQTPALQYQYTAPPTPQLSFQPSPNVPHDSIVDSIVAKFRQRSAVGWAKYGTTLDREDLGVFDWIQHAQEELMDGILYLEKLKKVYSSDMITAATVAATTAAVETARVAATATTTTGTVTSTSTMTIGASGTLSSA